MTVPKEASRFDFDPECSTFGEAFGEQRSTFSQSLLSAQKKDFGSSSDAAAIPFWELMMFFPIKGLLLRKKCITRFATVASDGSRPLIC